MNQADATTVLPVPVIDHVVINVHDQMAAVAAAFHRLGFALTPQGRHTLGSINHLAMFGPDYLELWGVPDGEPDHTDVKDWPTGLNAVVFATDDATALHAALTAVGVPALPPLGFSRPVATPAGPTDAAFRIVRLPPPTTPAGRLFFCQHLTRAAVWQDRWRRHPNGVLGIAGVEIAAQQPEIIAALWRRMFGPAAVVPIAGGVRLLAGLANIDVLGEVPPDGRAAAMTGLRLRVAALDHTADVLRAGGIAMTLADGRLRVPAAAACGVALSFAAG